MNTCPEASTKTELSLPREFEDLTGLVETDLNAIATMLTHRAHERLMLTRREYHRLHERLLNEMKSTLNDVLEPLSADRR